jgi:hypothetical protein
MVKKVTEKVEEKEKKVKTKKNSRDKITRMKAIRYFCIECCGYQVGVVKDCTDFACPLWSFRMGRGQEHTDVPMRRK